MKRDRKKPPLTHCEHCHEAIPVERQRRQAIYCSRVCRSKHGRQLFLEQNPNHPLEGTIPASTVGALSELLAAADLLRRGYHVFRAVSPACPCDLAVMSNSTLIRVEVTTAFRSTHTGKPMHARKLSSTHDVLALVFRDGTVEYTPPEFWLTHPPALPKQ